MAADGEHAAGDEQVHAHLGAAGGEEDVHHIVDVLKGGEARAHRRADEQPAEDVLAAQQPHEDGQGDDLGRLLADGRPVAGPIHRGEHQRDDEGEHAADEEDEQHLINRDVPRDVDLPEEGQDAQGDHQRAQGEEQVDAQRVAQAYGHHIAEQAEGQAHRQQAGEQPRLFPLLEHLAWRGRGQGGARHEHPGPGSGGVALEHVGEQVLDGQLGGGRLAEKDGLSVVVDVGAAVGALGKPGGEVVAAALTSHGGSSPDLKNRLYFGPWTGKGPGARRTPPARR